MPTTVHFIQIIQHLDEFPHEAQALVLSLSEELQIPIGVMRVEDDLRHLAETAEHEIVPTDFACAFRAPTEPRTTWLPTDK